MPTRIESTIDIDRPANDVYAFVTDSRNDPLWQTGVSSVVVQPSAPSASGTRITQRRRFLGVPFTLTWEVLEVSPGTQMTSRLLDGPFRGGGSYRFSATDTGCAVTLTMEGDLTAAAGFFGLGRRVFQSAARREIVSYLARLKQVLETVPTPSA